MPKINVPLEDICNKDTQSSGRNKSRYLGVEVMLNKAALYLDDSVIIVSKRDGKPEGEIPEGDAKNYYSAAESALKSVKDEIKTLKSSGKEVSKFGVMYEQLGDIRDVLAKIVDAKDAYIRKDEGRKRG